MLKTMLNSKRSVMLSCLLKATPTVFPYSFFIFSQYRELMLKKTLPTDLFSISFFPLFFFSISNIISPIPSRNQSRLLPAVARAAPTATRAVPTAASWIVYQRVDILYREIDRKFSMVILQAALLEADEFVVGAPEGVDAGSLRGTHQRPALSPPGRPPRAGRLPAAHQRVTPSPPGQPPCVRGPRTPAACEPRHRRLGGHTPEGHAALLPRVCA